MKMRKILITLMAVLLLTGCGDSTSVDESSIDTTKTDTNQTDTTKTEDKKILKEAEYVGVFGEDVFFNNIGDYVGCEFDITMIYNVKDADGKYVFTATEKTSTGWWYGC